MTKYLIVETDLNFPDLIVLEWKITTTTETNKQKRPLPVDLLSFNIPYTNVGNKERVNPRDPFQITSSAESLE